MSHIMIKDRIRDIPADWTPELLVMLIETNYWKTPDRIPACARAALAEAKSGGHPFFTVTIGSGGVAAVMHDDEAGLSDALAYTASGFAPVEMEVHLIVSKPVRERANVLMRELQMKTAAGGSA